MSNITALPGVTVAIGTMLITVLWTEPSKEIVQVSPGGWGDVRMGPNALSGWLSNSRPGCLGADQGYG